MIKLKRAYDSASKDDGLRVLVDRLWPRGLTKAKARVDLWAKNMAPSDGLRRLVHGDPTKWDEFVKAYAQAADSHHDDHDHHGHDHEHGHALDVNRHDDHIHQQGWCRLARGRNSARLRRVGSPRTRHDTIR